LSNPLRRGFTEEKGARFCLRQNTVTPFFLQGVFSHRHVAVKKRMKAYSIGFVRAEKAVGNKITDFIRFGVTPPKPEGSHTAMSLWNNG